MQPSISDEEIAQEAIKYISVQPATPASLYEAFRMGARIARQWQAKLTEQPKKLTLVLIKAACGHEYKTGILHTDEDDFRAQRAFLAQLNCLSCLEDTQEIQGQVVPFPRPSE